MKLGSLGVLSFSTILTASTAAWAEVPDATWDALRGRDVILQTEGGRRVGGKLIYVDPTTVVLEVPDGDSVTVNRVIVSWVRAAKDESLPKELTPRWHPGDPIPPGYYVKNETRLDLIISGSVVFGAAWVPSAIMAGVVGDRLFWIPLAGPWISIGMARGEGYGVIFYPVLIDGIQQAVGAGLLIGGIAASRTVLRSGVQQSKTWWMPVPISFGRGSVGLGIAGTM